MNRILINNKEIDLQVDDSIEVTISDKLELFDVAKIKIEFKKDSDLEIIYQSELEAKFDIVFSILENVIANVFEIKQEIKSKNQYKYYLDRYSKLNINKFYDCQTVKQMDIINLNGEYAEINFDLRTISTGNQKFDCLVYHNFDNTVSHINNSGVNMLEGILNFRETGMVYNGIKNCIVNQNSRILTLNNNKCTISPNLLIEEDQVEANHSAMIGSFNKEEMFYLQSRGITEEDATNLLVKGFLKQENNHEMIDQIIEKYWG